MKIIIAPDSFKGNMSSRRVCEIIKKALLKDIPGAGISCIPMADGGEGTVAAAVAATGGKKVYCQVLNPLRKEIKSFYGVSGDRKRAVIEMAAASGIELLGRDQLDPTQTTTFGTGMLIKYALDSGLRELVIGIGGSSTNDGGAGMMQALGFEFFDANGALIGPGIGGGQLLSITSVAANKVDKRLAQCIIHVACDVDNPLLGVNGAARVYAPQKGADDAMVKVLEKNLEHFAGVLIAADLADDCTHAGDGAAGGLGFALRNLPGARMESGAELIMDFSGFNERVKDADFMITGEGCTDAQSIRGKLCCQLAKRARRYGVGTILLSGGLAGDMDELRKYFDAVFSISMGVCTLDEALANAEKNLYETTRSIAALIKREEK